MMPMMVAAAGTSLLWSGYTREDAPAHRLSAIKLISNPNKSASRGGTAVFVLRLIGSPSTARPHLSASKELPGQPSRRRLENLQKKSSRNFQSIEMWAGDRDGWIGNVMIGGNGGGGSEDDDDVLLGAMDFCGNVLRSGIYL